MWQGASPVTAQGQQALAVPPIQGLPVKSQSPAHRPGGSQLSNPETEPPCVGQDELWVTVTYPQSLEAAKIRSEKTFAG